MMKLNYKIFVLLVACIVIATIGMCYIKYYELPPKNDKNKHECCDNKLEVNIQALDVKCINHTGVDFVCDNLNIIYPQLQDGEYFKFDQHGDLILNESWKTISKGRSV